MNREWNDFLAASGAVLKDGVVQHFGDPPSELRAAESGLIITDLSHLGLLRATGADATVFLQGQLTNDVTLLDEGHSHLSGYCNPKGRLLAVMRLFRRSGDIMLQMPVSVRDGVVAKLRMYVLRSKVSLEATNELECMGLSGRDAEQLLNGVMNSAPPAETDECRTVGDMSVIRLPGIHPRFEMIAPPRALMGLWDRLKNSARPVGTPAWAWLDIMAGIPIIYPETAGAFVPQMTNLELLGGVSFKKGCYTGQEIVARMHYLGRLKQRMYLAHAESGGCPRPGDPVYAAANPDQPAGTVVEGRTSPGGGFDLLAVIQIAETENGDLHLADAAGPKLEIRELPYPYGNPTLE